MQKIIPACVIGAVLVIAGWLAWGSINGNARPALSTSTTSTTSATTTGAATSDLAQ